MKNKRMEQKLESELAIDVSQCQCTEDGYYILPAYVNGVDYCNKETEEWIWSIGRRISDGVILASHDSIFYVHNEFECLWLRWLR
jgi:hypothetical protein